MDPVFNDIPTHTNLLEPSQPNPQSEDASAQPPAAIEMAHSEHNVAEEPTHTSNEVDKIAPAGTGDASTMLVEYSEAPSAGDYNLFDAPSSSYSLHPPAYFQLLHNLGLSRAVSFMYHTTHS